MIELMDNELVRMGKETVVTEYDALSARLHWKDLREVQEIVLSSATCSPSESQ
jgi:hypothetical protein